jgi:CubicO group peptidase (beta-lactamase class C family)
MSNLEAALRAADRIADRFMAEQHVPGLAYGVVMDGALVHCRGLGTLRVGEAAPPDADSVFRIASMTKSFTAAAVLSLRDEGLLSLDDPISRHVPELAELHGPTADAPPITVRHFLTMASGLGTDDPWGDRQQGLDLGSFSEILRGPLTFAWSPGTRFEYSNLGYGILGRLVTNVAGCEYRDVVRARLLAPLGLTATTFLREEVPPDRLALGYLWRDDTYIEEPIDPYGALASMGGIFTSVRDLARWIAFFADAYPPRDDPEVDGSPLSRASRREMQVAHNAFGLTITQRGAGVDPEVSAGGYGYGLFVEDHRELGRLVSHSGGYPGFGSNMRWLPESGLGVIVLTNHRYGWATRLGHDLLLSLARADIATPRLVRPAPALAEARATVERLLEAWDDERASSAFAMNVELDEPLDRRRAALEQIRRDHGPLEPDEVLPAESDSPLHRRWWLVDGHGGRVKVDIRLSPEPAPRIQTFNVTSIPNPEPTLAGIMEVIVGAMNGASPAVPAGLDLGPELDATSIARELRVAAARYAPLEMGPVVAGDGRKTATWRLHGPHGELDLAITRDATTGLVAALTMLPHPRPLATRAD